VSATPPQDLQLHFERLLADLSARFVNLDADEVLPAIEQALERIVLFFGVDRSSLAEFGAGEGQSETLACWAVPGVERLPLGPLPARLAWYVETLRRGETIALSRLPEGLPEAAAAEREYVLRSGMRSNLSFPLFVSGRPFGHIALGAFARSVEFPDAVIPRLRLVGEVLAGSLVRARAARRVRELTALLEAENAALRAEIASSHEFEQIVGESPELRGALRLVGQVAPTDTTVLLTGETGTGKELFARTIHARSPRAGRPLVTLNIAALPPTLIESELFGHEKGAFTGALSQRIGRFELARGGTLFIDEIGELPPELQAKLLRVLQEGEFERLGSSRTMRTDARIVAATHRDLEAAVRAGRFRADLLFRLSVFPIRIPPLRERRGDIAALAWHFVSRKQARLGRSIERIAPRSLAALEAYDWPGNVRELENVIERALVLSAGPVLDEETILSSTRRAAAAPDGGDTLRGAERAHVLRVLEESRWKINGAGNAADRLGLHPSTLRLRMQKLGIRRPAPDAPVH
jgi:transcriptional regulator with GAF, ATPase, and Fis domain